MPGTLWKLLNAVITRGGDIERAKKFESTYVLPAGTFSAYSVRRQLYVFGSASTPAGIPVGVRYQQLAAPGAPAMTGVLDAKGPSGKVYAIATYVDGNTYHFYDGSRVTAWDALADAAASFDTVAARLAALIDAQTLYKAKASGAVVEITAATPGTGFTIAASAVDNGAANTPTCIAAVVQANVAGVSEVRATGTVTITAGSDSAGVNKISSLTVNAVQLLAASVDWIDSNDATANALAVAINDNSFTSGYTASAAGAICTIQAAVGTGATPNGYVVDSTGAGNVTATDANMAGGVAKVTAVAQVNTVTIGGTTFGSTDLWKITLGGVDFQSTGRASATGTFAFWHKKRVWSPAGPIVYGSKLNDPTNWSDADPSSGAVTLSVADEVDGADYIVGLARYEGNVAIFARNAIVIYDLAADASTISIVQALDNTGTLAPRSIVSYGANDVFYLDETGIRSLRTRDAVQSAYASDVGSAIDTFIQPLLVEVGDDVSSKASAVIEAKDGRFMLAIGQYIVTLSQFPSSKIVAWSYIDFEATITDMIRVDRNICMRSGDVIYVYGGLSGDVYPEIDEFEIEATTPFISAKDPAALKQIEGFDMAAENVWRIELLEDPNNIEHYTDLGFLNGTTYNKDAIKGVGKTSHFAIRATCSAAGYASLSSTAVHHEIDAAKQ
ncbi:hypothetical protein [Mesorhizobium sp. M0139]|uniref:hypothetical protein n=1 Tax=Mesorhizobium sp. M0139 TaxID=2956892 RepID=UPI0033387CD2